MIDPEQLCQSLEARGFEFFSGVPCSYLQGAFARLETRPAFVQAPHEGVALSMAAGAELAGRRAAVFAQNSGLGNLLDPLTSLLMAYQVPVLICVSLRGWPRPEDDEPHHEAMGYATRPVLDGVRVASRVLEPRPASWADLLDDADAEYRQGRSFVALVPRDTIAPCPVPPRPETAPDRRDVVAALVRFLGDALVFSTTGMISRELFALDDSTRNFYMQGSMGHAIGLGLGAALAQPDRRVVVIDGDGAALMHLGASALVGDLGPANLTHVVLDNNGYQSTGGQRARSTPVDWAGLAIGLGYRTAAWCTDVRQFQRQLAAVAGTAGPHLVAARVAATARATPPRITTAHTNPQVRARFQERAGTCATSGVRQP